MEEEEHRAKVHYIGCSSWYDEWIWRSQIVFRPIHQHQISNNEPHSEHSLALLALGAQIKQKLVPSRKTEDPTASTSTFELLWRQEGKLG